MRAQTPHAPPERRTRRQREHARTRLALLLPVARLRSLSSSRFAAEPARFAPFALRGAALRRPERPYWSLSASHGPRTAQRLYRLDARGPSAGHSRAGKFVGRLGPLAVINQCKGAQAAQNDRLEIGNGPQSEDHVA